LRSGPGSAEVALSPRSGGYLNAPAARPCLDRATPFDRGSRVADERTAGSVRGDSTTPFPRQGWLPCGTCAARRFPVLRLSGWSLAGLFAPARANRPTPTEVPAHSFGQLERGPSVVQVDDVASARRGYQRKAPGAWKLDRVVARASTRAHGHGPTWDLVRQNTTAPRYGVGGHVVAAGPPQSVVNTRPSEPPGRPLSHQRSAKSRSRCDRRTRSAGCASEAPAMSRADIPQGAPLRIGSGLTSR
jgi:hypothetical protein